jgi:hypothetical protein
MFPICAADAGKVLNRALQQVWETGDFKGKKEQVLSVYPGSRTGAKSRGCLQNGAVCRAWENRTMQSMSAGSSCG